MTRSEISKKINILQKNYSLERKKLITLYDSLIDDPSALDEFEKIFLKEIKTLGVVKDPSSPDSIQYFGNTFYRNGNTKYDNGIFAYNEKSNILFLKTNFENRVKEKFRLDDVSLHKFIRIMVKKHIPVNKFIDLTSIESYEIE